MEVNAELEHELTIFERESAMRVGRDWEEEPPDIPPSAHAVEHDLDRADLADAYAILDGENVRVAVCEGCGLSPCRCCEFCLTSPCRCEPLSQREIRQMYARWDAGPGRVQRP